MSGGRSGAESGDATACLPVVLLHGFMQGPDEWDDVAAEFTRFGRTVVHTPDLNPTTREEATMDALVEKVGSAVEAARDAAGGARVLMLGYSLGGRVAQAYADAHPETLCALVLESAGMGPADAHEREALATRDARWAQRLRDEPLVDFVDYWEGLPLFESQRDLPAGIRADMRAARLGRSPQALAWLCEGAGQHTMPEAREGRVRLERIAAAGVPILFVYGGRDSKYTDVANGLPSCVHRMRCEGAGHNVHRERPSSFAAIVESFADEAMTDEDEEGRI